MAFESKTIFFARCDSCGNRFERGDMTLHFDDVAEAVETVRDDDWDASDDGSAVTCERCVEERRRDKERKANTNA